MKAIIVIMSGLFLSLAANAQETVTCTGGDCLSSGYEVRDASNDLQEIGICNGGDCTTAGWNIFRLDGFNTSVSCADNSCYGSGFQEIDPANNSELVRNRTCVADSLGVGDCLANGWEDEYYGTNARTERVSCTDGSDCRNGFIIETIVDNTASMEAEIAALKEQAQLKRQEFRAYLKENKEVNKELGAEIVELIKQRIALKKELRQNGGIQILDSKEAVCLTAGGCFSSGYTLN